MAEASDALESVVKKAQIKFTGPQNRTLQTILQASATKIVNEAKNNIKKKGSFQTRFKGREITAQRLRDSGNLLGSIQQQPDFKKNLLKVKDGSFGVKYAAMQEFGGTIRPVRRKFLTVPFGGDRFFAKRRLSQFPDQNISFRRSRNNGPTIVFVKLGAQQIPAYVLRKSVNIPARPFLTPAFDNQRKKVLKFLFKHLQDSFK